MTNKTDNLSDNLQGSTLIADRPDNASNDELPTNRLTGRLQPDDAVEPAPDVDWVASLATTTFTESLTEASPNRWEPSGMAQHTAAPRMVPTIGARLTTGMKKSVIVVAMLGLSIGVLAAAGYGLLSTEWLAGVLAPQPAAPLQIEQQKPAQASEQAQQAPLPDVAQGGTLPVIEAPLNGSAKELRDRGIAEYKLGNFNEAIRLLEGSTNLDGDDAITYYQLGLAYMVAPKREHALEDAEMAFRTAASLQPDWAAPQQGLAESLIRRNFYKDAVKPALEATSLDPTLGEAWMTLGRAYHGSGQEVEATRAFAEAARHSPPPLVQP